MELEDRTVLVLGGAGLVGLAVCRRILERSPARVVLGSLYHREVEEALDELSGQARANDVEMKGTWGDLFLPSELKDRPRSEILADPKARERLLDDLYGELTDDVLRRSTLGKLLLDEQPSVIVDCLNTAGAIAYQNVFASAAELRRAAREGDALEAVERHLSILYLPQLIRHVQIGLEGMRRVGTDVYVKIGTAGTGGMGLNIPFTHSEERPSRVLLAKSGLAGAQTLLLYLMARTPGAPAVKEVKPTAAISWKSISYGPVTRAGQPLFRSDATGPVDGHAAFGDAAESSYRKLDEPLEGVFLHAGENGLFSLSEFEVLTSLGLMEYVTPEEIADNVIREIEGHPTGADVVAALDAATMGPTYRAGVLRRVALDRMEALEAREGVRSVAYEMLGPPRLSKLLFEAEMLRRIHGTLESAAELDPDETASRAHELVQDDDDFRQRILTIGIPILLPDGERILRGATVKVPFAEGDPKPFGRVSDRGWVDLRAGNWEKWRERARSMLDEVDSRPGPDAGSQGDHDFGERTGTIRPGRMGAWIFRYEDEGERIKR